MFEENSKILYKYFEDIMKIFYDKKSYFKMHDLESFVSYQI